jgi:anti-anti-sigma regulatory factor
MPIEYKKNRAVFRNEVSVEEAETLLEWLQNKPTAKVDLSALSHMHTASLQVLMAAKTEVANWPKDADLRAWLEPVLKSKV